MLSLGFHFILLITRIQIQVNERGVGGMSIGTRYLIVKKEFRPYLAESRAAFLRRSFTSALNETRLHRFPLCNSSEELRETR